MTKNPEVPDLAALLAPYSRTAAPEVALPELDLDLDALLAPYLRAPVRRLTSSEA